MGRRRECGAASLVWVLALGAAVVGAAGGVAVGAGSGGAERTVNVPLTPVRFYLCPGDAEPLGQLHRGDRVIATGRDATGGWLELRGPDLAGRVWMHAGFVVPDRSTDSLPVVECRPTTYAAPPDTPGDGGAPGQPGGATTDGDGGGGGGASDSAGPTIDAIGATPGEIYEEYFGGSSPCINQTTSTITVSISDPSGVASADFTWSFPGASGVGSLTGSGTYQGALGPFPYGTYSVPSSGVDVTVTVSATDGAGNSSSRSRTVRLRSAEECIV